MQDLTGRFPMALAPTSQEGGGLVDHGQGQAAMTAPGSVPVTPMPPPADGPVLPMPQVSGTTIPLSHAPGSAEPPPEPGGFGAWAGKPSGAAGFWKDVP
jgi:hypothetical protein